MYQTTVEGLPCREGKRVSFAGRVAGAMECRAGYILREALGAETAAVSAGVRAGEEGIDLLPDSGKALFISYREMLEITPSDYRVEISLGKGARLTLMNLGRSFDDLVRTLRASRNELTLRDMLMHEQLLRQGVKAELSVGDAGSSARISTPVEARLYQTALVLVPESRDPVRIPYGFVEDIRDEDYRLVIRVEGEGDYTLSRMGRHHDDFRRTLAGAMNDLALESQAMLGELAPGVEQPAIRRAASLMRDGRAAARRDLDAIDPLIWPRLESGLEAVGISEEYRFLRSMMGAGDVFIGFKRGLASESGGDYIWFLVPLIGTGPDAPGNAMAMEAGDSEGGSRATYFFRITGRDDYRLVHGTGAKEELAARSAETLNRCLLAVNFRREPIYLPDERLVEPQYARYWHSVRTLPELKQLRKLFIGRVIHSSPEQWKADVLDLLEFNVKAANDQEKWKKGRAGPAGC